MVDALIHISDHTNRLLNIVKAKYGLKDKSQAVEQMAVEYEEMVLEQNFKPEFIEEVKRAEKGKFVKIKSIKQLFE